MSRWQAQSIRQQSRRASAWPRWLALILFLLAIFLLTRVVLHHWHKNPATQITEPVQPASPPSQPVQFDFYTVLPKMAVSSPTPPPTDSPAFPKAKTAVTAVSAAVTPSLPSAHLPPAAAGLYVLQIAAVRQPKDAERLRNQMHEAGYPTFVQPYQADQILWYRVMVGPYASQDLAEHSQSQLESRGTHSLLLKMQPHST